MGKATGVPRPPADVAAQQAVAAESKASPPPPPSPPAEAGKEYTIRPGDTLGQLAKQLYGDPSKARELAKLNKIQDPDKIFAGRKLQLPTREQMSGTSSYAPARTNDKKVDLNGGVGKAAAPAAPGAAAQAAAAPPAAAPAAAGAPTAAAGAPSATPAATAAAGQSPEPSIDIAKLKDAVRDQVEPTIASLDPKNAELLKKIDASGTGAAKSNGRIDKSEVDRYVQDLTKQILATTDAKLAAPLDQDLKVAEQLSKQLAKRSYLKENADLAGLIDADAKDSKTAAKIGNQDGHLSLGELEHFIAERTQRASDAKASKDVKSEEYYRGILEVAEALRKSMVSSGPSAAPSPEALPLAVP